MDQLDLVADAIVGRAGAIITVAGAAALLTIIVFLLQSFSSPGRRAAAHRRYGPNPGIGHHDSHGYGHGPDFDYELGSISAKLDRIAAAVEPRGWGLLRRIGANVFWSVFGVAAGFAVEALWPVSSYYY